MKRFLLLGFLTLAGAPFLHAGVKPLVNMKDVKERIEELLPVVQTEIETLTKQVESIGLLNVASMPKGDSDSADASLSAILKDLSEKYGAGLEEEDL